MNNLISLSALALTYTAIAAVLQLVSSGPLPTDKNAQQLTTLQTLEQHFYKSYCYFWGFVPEKLIKFRKPVHRYKERIISVRAITPQCIKLLLEIEYEFPSEAQLKPLRETKLPIIWVLGGPGSGKGTLCSMFKETESYTHISVGDLLRDEVNSPPSPSTGQLIQEIMTQGQLVPKTLAITLLVRKMLSLLDSTQGFLIDGFPRSVDQAILFKNTIRSPDAIVLLEAGDDTLRKRALGRNQGRTDDNEETFRKRLKVYKDQTLAFTRDKRFAEKLKPINVEGSKEDNFKLFETAIKESLHGHG